MEKLSPLAGWLELSLVAAMALLFGFFAMHQVTHTGFFTARFGPVEMVCLYGPILVAVAAPLVKVGTGRQNPARPFDAIAKLSLSVGSLVLLIVFPFDYSHLADVLPEVIRFALGWITNDIAKIVLALQVILGPLSAFSAMSKYFSVRRQESSTAS